MNRKKHLKPFRSNTQHMLVPEIGLCVWDGGYHNMKWWLMSQTPDEIIDKFRSGFVKVWRQIPEQDRNTLIDHWGLGGAARRRSKARVTIALEWKLKFYSPLSIYKDKHDYALGQCARDGLKLWLSSWFVTRAIPCELEHVIAHELGHAISFARGWCDEHPCDAESIVCDDCEREADKYATSWGFGPPLIMMSRLELPPPGWLRNLDRTKQSGPRVVRRRREFMSTKFGY